MAQTQGDYHNFMDYPDHLEFRGIIVPQRVIRAPTAFNRFPSILFTSNTVAGVRVQDFINENTASLDNPNEVPAVTERGIRISLRIVWPGYQEWKVDNVVVVSQAQGGGALYSKARLAIAICKRIGLFWDDMAHNASSDPRGDWWIQNISFENLYLVELRHVMAGSWQPVLAVRVA